MCAVECLHRHPAHAARRKAWCMDHDPARQMAIATPPAACARLDPCRTRQQKRKAEDEHSEEEGEGHEDFDPAQLREHEEFTKARRVQWRSGKQGVCRGSAARLDS